MCQIKNTYIILTWLFLLPLGIFAQRVEKNIAFTSKNAEQPETHLLDLYLPNPTKYPNPDILVFMHGGSWVTGKKDTYWWFGRKLARRGKAVAIVNYRLAPQAQYKQMLQDGQAALTWLHAHAAYYNMNPRRIFVSGHSAGGHLAAWLAIQNPSTATEITPSATPVQGAILIDAFGLDIYNYLRTHQAESDRVFYKTFTDKPATWKAGSPIYALTETKNNPVLLFYGSRTFPTIISESKAYYSRLQETGTLSEIVEIKGKKHIAMITQFIIGGRKTAKKMVSWMDAQPSNN